MLVVAYALHVHTRSHVRTCACSRSSVCSIIPVLKVASANVSVLLHVCARARLGVRSTWTRFALAVHVMSWPVVLPSSLPR